MIETPQAYISQSYDRLYFRRPDYTLNEARHEAASHAQEMGDNWTRTRYLGKQAVPLHDHEDWEGCNECPEWAVWAFEIYEGAYRP